MVACPSEQELSGLVTGTLAARDIERVTAHLESCPACEARVSALDQLSDPLMSGLRGRAGRNGGPPGQREKGQSSARGGWLGGCE
jgi:anti-sigma factor RsiW